MSFPRYPKYKDSGVEWLGEVPMGWSVNQLKRSFEVKLGKMLQPESKHKNDELHPYLRAANLQWSGIDTSDIKQMWFSSRDREQLLLKKDDLLVSEGGDVGRSCLWKNELDQCYFQNSVNRIRPYDGNSTSYLCYWISTVKDKGYIDMLCNKSTIAHFTAEKVESVPIPIPTPLEQNAIAGFLDRETAKIDELVAEQRWLMELLKEKRQAVISAAVTGRFLMVKSELRMVNGKLTLHDLDTPVIAQPNNQGHYHTPEDRPAILHNNRITLPAPDLDLSKLKLLKTKPSGIEWLGNIPEHWELCKMSHFFRAGKGKNGQKLTKEFCAENAGEYPVYSGQTENEGVMGRWVEFEFDSGDEGVLFSTTVGAKAMHLRHLFGKFSLSQNCMIIWPTNESCQTRFFYYHFQPLFQYERGLIPEHMQASFRIEDLYGYRIAIPPVKEQATIVVNLDSRLSEIDMLYTEVLHAIDLLQERRTALISAAVTGQIDVQKREYL